MNWFQDKDIEEKYGQAVYYVKSSPRSTYTFRCIILARGYQWNTYSRFDSRSYSSAYQEDIVKVTSKDPKKSKKLLVAKLDSFYGSDPGIRNIPHIITEGCILRTEEEQNAIDQQENVLQEIAIQKSKERLKINTELATLTNGTPPYSSISPITYESREDLLKAINLIEDHGYKVKSFESVMDYRHQLIVKHDD